MHTHSHIGIPDMLSKPKRIAFSLALVVALAGCASGANGENSGYKKFIGGLTGAAAGGYAGAQFGKGQGKLATTALGVVVGFLGGMAVGNELDEKDKLEASAAMALALNEARTVSWQGQNNNGGVIRTKRAPKKAGMVCRDYQHYGTIDGEQRQAVGRACKQQDGTWKIVSS